MDSCNIPLLLAPANLSLYFAFYMYETNLALKMAAYWPHCHRMMENTLPKPNWDCTSGGSLRLCHQLELRLGPGPSQGSGEVVKRKADFNAKRKKKAKTHYLWTVIQAMWPPCEKWLSMREGCRLKRSSVTQAPQCQHQKATACEIEASEAMRKNY